MRAESTNADENSCRLITISFLNALSFPHTFIHVFIVPSPTVISPQHRPIEALKIVHLLLMMLCSVMLVVYNYKHISKLSQCRHINLTSLLHADKKTGVPLQNANKVGRIFMSVSHSVVSMNYSRSVWSWTTGREITRALSTPHEHLTNFN